MTDYLTSSLRDRRVKSYSNYYDNFFNGQKENHQKTRKRIKQSKTKTTKKYKQKQNKTTKNKKRRLLKDSTNLKTRKSKKNKSTSSRSKISDESDSDFIDQESTGSESSFSEILKNQKKINKKSDHDRSGNESYDEDDESTSELSSSDQENTKLTKITNKKKKQKKNNHNLAKKKKQKKTTKEKQKQKQKQKPKPKPKQKQKQTNKIKKQKQRQKTTKLIFREKKYDPKEFYKLNLELQQNKFLRKLKVHKVKNNLQTQKKFTKQINQLINQKYESLRSNYKNYKELRTTKMKNLLFETRKISTERKEMAQKLIKELLLEKKSIEQQLENPPNNSQKKILENKKTKYLKEHQKEINTLEIEHEKEIHNLKADQEKKREKVGLLKQKLTLLKQMNKENKVDQEKQQKQEQTLFKELESQRKLHYLLQTMGGISVQKSEKDSFVCICTNPNQTKQLNFKLKINSCKSKEDSEIQYEPLKIEFSGIIDENELPDYINSTILFPLEQAPLFLCKVINEVYKN
ncbi:monopolin complex subunit csm1 [Anaeramoeba flamelloides]|uniref:Monopolin complex subunit csm1 n=1 Tax=Anaeramoeba flamelloides TaxID=1746091 RepID=A0ABQ8YGW5_9EUKA|nr:monopolin complex subunit csm1 [Anaeramoeba flamelloides]